MRIRASQVYVMVSVDLHGARSKRGAFNDEMQELGWDKVPNVTTTWFKVLPGPVRSKKARRESIKRDLDKAAELSEIAGWNAAAHDGQGPPIQLVSG